MTVAGDWRAESGPWIEQPRPPTRPTEILLPVRMGVGPVWDHANRVGGWYAFLDIPPGRDAWLECDHIHVNQDDAWECAEGYARSTARIRLEQARG